MASWFDDPCFDHEAETVGAYTLTGDAWRRLQSLRERGVACSRVIAVAGVTFRKQAIEQALREGAGTASLEAEPQNRYDKHAIKVCLGGKHVGYVPASMAAQMCAPSLTPYVCSIAGGSTPHVWLVVV